MYKVFSLLAVILISTIHSFSQNENFVLARQSMENSDFKKAIKQLTISIKEDSTYPFSWASRGQCYIELGKVNLAEKDLEAAYNIAPNNEELIEYLSYNYRRLNRKNKSISLARDLYPRKEVLKSDILSMKLGSCYYFNQELDSAEFYLENALRLNENLHVVLNNLAWTKIELGKPNEAIPFFKKAYEVEPSSYQNVNNLGYAYYLNDELEKAEKYILESKELNPNNSFVYRNLGLVYMKRENKKQACKYFKKAIKLNIVEKWGEHYVTELRAYCEK